MSFSSDFLAQKEVVLFHGDSITDWTNRERDALGYGYPYFIASLLSSMFVNKDLKFINRGISGYRTTELVNCWEEDCIKLKPTIVSILIGINDTWRRYDANDPTSVEKFEENYRNILQRAVDACNPKFMIIEPFLLPSKQELCMMREDLDPKILVVRKLAMEYNAVFIPMDGIFASAYMNKKPEFWAEDGIHPTNVGHALIANSWINAIK